MKTCKKCESEFDGRRCPACAKSYHAQYVQDHKEAHNRHGAAYKVRNADKVKAANVKYRTENAEQEKVRCAAYRANNKEKRKASVTRYYVEHKDKCAAASKAWKNSNIDQVREQARLFTREYYKDHRAEAIAHSRKRRQHLGKVTPSWADMEAIAAVYREAKRLSQETGVEHHVDHDIPLRGRLVSGLHVETNLRAIPAKENMLKRNTFEIA